MRALGLDVTLNDWSAYKDNDVVVFMGYDHDIRRARRDNPNIKVVLADPKLSNPGYISAARDADLLLVSSVEQRDAFLPFNSNVHIHHMFPLLPEKPRIHNNSRCLVIAYHGNRVHLDAMCLTLIPALGALAKYRHIEMRCIYNIAAHGMADLRSMEDVGVKVAHVQWDENSLVDVLREADIGIMPNELPVHNKHHVLLHTAYKTGNFAYEPFDHITRFKASANPGRLLPFVCAGLPVVADFCPSASQFIDDGSTGFIVSSSHGWHYALAKLANSPELRQSFADCLRERVINARNDLALRFVDACSATSLPSPPVIEDVIPIDYLQQLSHKYLKPPEKSFAWLRRLLYRHIIRKIKFN